jgi:putative hydrolase of the HAD superfamily
MIEKLKGRYLLAVLTNNSEHRMRADEHLGIYKPFDKVYQSCKIGLKKPNADFYQYAQRDIGVASDEILFVDDVARNVDAARLLGWHAFRYESLDSFATELLAHGVKID